MALRAGRAKKPGLAALAEEGSVESLLCEA